MSQEINKYFLILIKIKFLLIKLHINNNSDNNVDTTTKRLFSEIKKKP